MGWLFLLDNLHVGGSQKKTVNVANRLAARGHAIHVAFLSRRTDLLAHLDDGVCTLSLERKKKLDREVIKTLRAYIVEKEILGLWNVNLFPMLCGYLATRELASKPRRLVSINTTVFQNLRERLKMTVYAPVIHGMDLVVFGSADQQRRWSNAYFLRKRRTRVIYNGVDTDFYYPCNEAIKSSSTRKQLGFGEDDFVIGMVAQFRREKSHDVLLKALGSLRRNNVPAKLLLVGDGPEQSETRRLVGKMSLEEYVTFVGLVHDVRAYLRAMDVFVLTSMSETFPNAALEAMAMKRPVVLSGLGGASEMVSHGVSGLVYQPGDVEQLIAAIKELVPVDTRKAFGQAARERVCSEFMFERMVKDYEAAMQMSSLDLRNPCRGR